MSDSNITITQGTGTNVDTRTVGSDHRQVIVLGDPVTTDSVAVVRGTDPVSNDEGIVVRDVNTSAIAAGLSSVRVRDIVTGTITTVATVTNITNTVAVYFDRANPSTSVYGSDGTTQRNLQTNTSGAIKVYDIVDGSIVVRSITNTVSVYFDRGNPAVSVYGSDGTTQRNLQTNSSGAIKVYDIVDGSIVVRSITNTVAVYFDRGDPGVKITSGTLTGITNTVQVFLPDTGHELGTIRGNTNTLTVFLPDTGHELGSIKGINSTVSVAFSPAKPVVLADIQSTSSIFTVSGSSAAVSVSGATLVSPSANYSFKVFALALTTTAQVQVVPKFTNGAGTGPTEYWRYALQAPTAGIAGANLAVSPPAYLFATGSNTTLSLVLDTASLVHYSVSYIKESS